MIKFLESSEKLENLDFAQLNSYATRSLSIADNLVTNNTDDLKERVDRNKKLSSTDNLHYLYPNGHRITHQMRWFKGSRDRCLRSDIAA